MLAGAVMMQEHQIQNKNKLKLNYIDKTRLYQPNALLTPYAYIAVISLLKNV